MTPGHAERMYDSSSACKPPFYIYLKLRPSQFRARFQDKQPVFHRIKTVELSSIPMAFSGATDGRKPFPLNASNRRYNASME